MTKKPYLRIDPWHNSKWLDFLATWGLKEGDRIYGEFGNGENFYFVIKKPYVELYTETREVYIGNEFWTGMSVQQLLIEWDILK